VGTSVSFQAYQPVVMHNNKNIPVPKFFDIGSKDIGRWQTSQEKPIF